MVAESAAAGALPTVSPAPGEVASSVIEGAGSAPAGASAPSGAATGGDEVESGGRVQKVQPSNSEGGDSRCVGSCSRRTARRPRDTPGPSNLRSSSGSRGAL
eukprot:2384337-Pleurochrysis_carterae.AAC.1